MSSACQAGRRKSSTKMNFSHVPNPFVITQSVSTGCAAVQINAVAKLDGMALTVAPVLNCQDVFTEIAHLQMAKKSHTLAIAMDHGKELFVIFPSATKIATGMVCVLELLEKSTGVSAAQGGVESNVRLVTGSSAVAPSVRSHDASTTTMARQ